MKIIAIVNAHALAHVTRLLEVSKILREHGHNIQFAGYGQFLEIAQDAGFETEELPYISRQHLIDTVRSQRMDKLYKLRDLEKFIEAEVAYFKKIKPELVLIDCRPTARTSADHCGIKTAAVLNVHMSLYRRLPFFSYGDYAEFLSCLDSIETKIECYLYDQLVMRGLNKLRKKMGLKRYFGNEHEEGDLSLFADIPEFNPVRYLPTHAHYVGPLTWHNDLPEPSCLSKLDPNRKTVYFTLGSDSLQELLSHLESLTQEGIQVVVAYGKFDESILSMQPSQHVYLEEYVNAEKLLPYCDAVCCHGGNGTLYQALSFGLPIVAVATHAEQNIGAKRLQQLGLGKSLRLKDVQTKGFSSVIQAVKSILDDDNMSVRCKEFSSILKNWNGASNSAEKIESFMC